jgi:hypothetical protein
LDFSKNLRGVQIFDFLGGYTLPALSPWETLINTINLIVIIIIICCEE